MYTRALVAVGWQKKLAERKKRVQKKAELKEWS